MAPTCLPTQTAAVVLSREGPLPSPPCFAACVCVCVCLCPVCKPPPLLLSIPGCLPQAERRAEKEARDETRRQEELRSYKALMTQEHMVTSKELGQKYASVEDYEDDFM